MPFQALLAPLAIMPLRIKGSLESAYAFFVLALFEVSSFGLGRKKPCVAKCITEGDCPSKPLTDSSLAAAPLTILTFIFLLVKSCCKLDISFAVPGKDVHEAFAVLGLAVVEAAIPGRTLKSAFPSKKTEASCFCFLSSLFTNKRTLVYCCSS